MSPQRRNGDFSACWDEREAAFGGVCRWPLVVFGSTRPKKNQKKSGGASGLASLSGTSGLIFVTFLFRLGQQRELRCRGLRDTRSPNPLSFLLTHHGNVPNGRRQFLPSALAGGRSAGCLCLNGPLLPTDGGAAALPLSPPIHARTRRGFRREEAPRNGFGWD